MKKLDLDKLIPEGMRQKAKPIAIVDRSLRVAWLSEGFMLEFGLASGVYGKHLSEICGDDCSGLIESIQEGLNVEGSLNMGAKPRHSTRVEFNAMPVSDSSGCIHYVVIAMVPATDPNAKVMAWTIATDVRTLIAGAMD